MKADELYNTPHTIPTPSTLVEAHILGVHLWHGNTERGMCVARVPDSWMDARQAGVLFANGFGVKKGWHQAYEPGWIITW